MSLEQIGITLLLTHLKITRATAELSNKACYWPRWVRWRHYWRETIAEAYKCALCVLSPIIGKTACSQWARFTIAHCKERQYITSSQRPKTIVFSPSWAPFEKLEMDSCRVSLNSNASDLSTTKIQKIDRVKNRVCKIHPRSIYFNSRIICVHYIDTSCLIETEILTKICQKTCFKFHFIATLFFYIMLYKALIIN